MKKFLAPILAIVIASIGFSLAKAYQRKAAIEQKLAEARQIEQEVQQLLQSDSATQATMQATLEEIANLEKANRDLHRLRNEVGQLRQQTNRIETLREENHRLATSLEQARQTGQVALDSLGFRESDGWQDVGMATPPDAIMTFFYYLRRGDPEALIERSQLSDPIRELLDQRRPEELERVRVSMRESTADISGFRIDSIEERENDKLIVQVQTALNGERLPIDLIKSGSQWRFNFTENSPF